MTLLEAKNLRVYFKIMKGVVKAVDDVSFTLDRGETLGLVGESGCGKTTTAFAIMKLLPPNGRIVDGVIQFKDKVIARSELELIARIRGALTERNWLELTKMLVAKEEEEIGSGDSELLVSPDSKDKRFELKYAATRKRVAARIKYIAGRLETHIQEPDFEKKYREKFNKELDRIENSYYYKRAKKKISRKTEHDMTLIRWKQISIIFQSAMNAFNPVYRVGDQIVEAILTHEKMSKREAREKAMQLFKVVGIDPSRIRGYPHEFSGGMRQRAMIAMALACNPDLIIADEPTTALDVIMQDRILGEIKKLQTKLNIAMIIITHDISVVAETAEKIAIMYAGKIAETGNTMSIFHHPAHPYTIGLLGAFPSIKGGKKRLDAIPGSPPDLANPPPGCRFHPRCKYAKDLCSQAQPPYVEVAPNHIAACYFAKEIFREKYGGGAQ
jgi:peptide/nickel transport system ATP-binding protein